jgi:putative ABC transport system ATP-binding protein
VALPAAIAGETKADYGNRVEEILDSVGLREHRGRLPAQLSGGEQQRVAIARALIMKPAVILADEPTGNLDSRTGAEVMAVMKGLHDEGQTIVLVTHDAKNAGLADRVFFMRDGQLIRETKLGAAADPTELVSQLVELET